MLADICRGVFTATRQNVSFYWTANESHREGENETGSQWVISSCPDTGTPVRHTNPENKETDELAVNLSHGVSNLCVLWLTRAQLCSCVVCILALCLILRLPSLWVLSVLGVVSRRAAPRSCCQEAVRMLTRSCSERVFSLYNNSYIYSR